MIILDTNVVSELLRERPDERVYAFLNGLPTEAVFITCVTPMELRYGLDMLPEGRRKSELRVAIERLVSRRFAGKIEPLDLESAEFAGALMARRRMQGMNIDVRDLQIAAIAVTREATLLTRNVRDFFDLPIAVINPWTHKA